MADVSIARAGTLTFFDGAGHPTVLQYEDGDLALGVDWGGVIHRWPGLRGRQNRLACRTWYEDEPVEECLGCHKPTRNRVGELWYPLCPRCHRVAQAEAIEDVQP